MGAVIDFSLEAKGDLHTFTTENARLPVGPDPGMFLVTDPGEPSGLKWISVAPGNDVNAWHKSGDAFGSEAKLGTSDDVDLIMVRNGLECIRLNKNGDFLPLGRSTVPGVITTNLDEGIDIPFAARFRGYNQAGNNAMTCVGNGEVGRPAVVFIGSFENGALFYRNLEVDIYCSDVLDSATPFKAASFTYSETKFFTEKIGLYGVAAVARQTVTGSRSGGAALTDLLTKLALLGAIIDGTSA